MSRLRFHGSLRLLALLALCAATPALAHPGHPGHEGLRGWAGFAHPFTGLDHMLAMLAVGLWAALRGGTARLTWPATFLAAMAVGFNLRAFSPWALEGGVLVSVVVLGGLTALGLRGREPLGLAVVGAAGVLHGMAHAADIGLAAPAFELGMLAATALLHAAGLAVGLLLGRFERMAWIRLLGAGVAAGGLVLAVAG
jgi:urease accessory protein